MSVHDPYWSPRLEVNESRAIFHQWEQLEASGCIDNFRITAGEKEGFREGFYFADSDAYKWLDAAARIYLKKPDPALADLIDGLITLLSRAQSPDGYLFTYNQIHFPTIRWANLMIEHELYCHGHLIEAGVSHFQATNQTEMLAIARRAADRVTADFLGKGADYTPGHEEIEIALLRLYRLTGHAPYLDLATQFIEQRGRKSRLRFAVSMLKQLRSMASRLSEIRKQRQNYLALNPKYAPNKLPPGNVAKSASNAYLRWLISALNGKYNQQHAPVRHQNIPVGHSVRFGYFQTAVAMLSRTAGDPTLIPAMESAWERMVSRRMYVTGGIGSVPQLEGFGNDYELDPVYAYAETCAAIASLFWNWELALLTGEARYSDLFEWQLYNAASVGVGLSGENYLYNNPLTCHAGVTRKSWYSCPCCPSNLSRTWADLGRYILSLDGDGLWIHQYIGSHASFQFTSPMQVTLDSGLPWNGKVKIKMDPSTPTQFTLHLRIPSWVSNHAEQYTIKVNDKPVCPQDGVLSPLAEDSEPDIQSYDPRRSRFLSIRRNWAPGVIVELDFGMQINFLHAHPRVRGHAGKIAVTRGPLVYCLENIDNPGVNIFSTRLDPDSLQVEFAPELLEGCTILNGRSTDGSPLTFIP
ncbi:MAG TPA: beta-L-arabinofuranosidase domain-containing protein, partial [Anaerolineales bacterium]|nr:beta-L-arabinofuranosidase domain-containing protein [Anaerolineales bacterium]